MCVYIICMHVCICMYACISICVCMYILYMCMLYIIYVCVCMYILYMCMCVYYVWVCMYICICVCIYVCMYMYIYMYIFILFKYIYDAHVCVSDSFLHFLPYPILFLPRFLFSSPLPPPLPLPDIGGSSCSMSVSSISSTCISMP